MVKLQDSRGCYHLNVPLSLVKFQNWKKGDEFLFVPAENGDVVITQLKADG